ncbi:Usher syndrome type-1C protein-binding protein [Melia azedarach]|uniref:Usher syndrome type-1C protein-binding protein n=1 Tax=Melia azedarach TaxID=155640 RepID=A0ACC1XTW5_MELAZ|nr:Usher syndrome type-1C protein-binding protein [Melia azedarach]
MSSKKPSKEGNRLTKYVKKSVKMLMKARDCYIQSMSQCSDTVVFSTAMGCPTGHINTLPRSYSVSSTRSSKDEDFRELLRVASTKSLGKKIDLEFQKRQQLARQSPTPSPGTNKMPRSHSTGIGIGRIDEDKPCDFEDDLKARPGANLYPRSKSYAVSRRTGLVSA